MTRGGVSGENGEIAMLKCAPNLGRMLLVLVLIGATQGKSILGGEVGEEITKDIRMKGTIIKRTISKGTMVIKMGGRHIREQGLQGEGGDGTTTEEGNQPINNK